MSELVKLSVSLQPRIPEGKNQGRRACGIRQPISAPPLPLELECASKIDNQSPLYLKLMIFFYLYENSLKYKYEQLDFYDLIYFNVTIVKSYN